MALLHALSVRKRRKKILGDIEPSHSQDWKIFGPTDKQNIVQDLSLVRKSCDIDHNTIKYLVRDRAMKITLQIFIRIYAAFQKGKLTLLCTNNISETVYVIYFSYCFTTRHDFFFLLLFYFCKKLYCVSLVHAWERAPRWLEGCLVVARKGLRHDLTLLY